MEINNAVYHEHSEFSSQNENDEFLGNDMTPDKARNDLLDTVYGIFKASEDPLEKEVGEFLASNPDLQEEVLAFIKASAEGEYSEFLRKEDDFEGKTLVQITNLLSDEIKDLASVGYGGKDNDWFWEDKDRTATERYEEIIEDVVDVTEHSKKYETKDLLGGTLADKIYENSTTLTPEQVEMLSKIKLGESGYTLATAALIPRNAIGALENTLVNLPSEMMSLQHTLFQYMYYRLRSVGNNEDFKGQREWDIKTREMGEAYGIYGMLNMITTKEGLQQASDAISEYFDGEMTAGETADLIVVLLALVGGAGVLASRIKPGGKLGNGIKNIGNAASKASDYLSGDALIGKIADSFNPLDSDYNYAGATVDGEVVDVSSNAPNVQERYADYNNSSSVSDAYEIADNLRKVDLPNSDKIDITELDRNLDKLESGKELSLQEKANLKGRIDTNHPALVIVDKALKRAGDKLTMIGFAGIKDLNDVIGQKLVDSIVADFKNTVRDKYGIDLIMDDYKNFIGFPEGGKSIPQAELDEIYNSILKENLTGTPGEKFLGSDKVKVVSTETHISENPTQKDIFLTLAEGRSKIERETAGGDVFEIDEVPTQYSKTAEKYYDFTDMTPYSYIDKNAGMRYTFHVEDGVLIKKVEKEVEPGVFEFRGENNILISTAGGDITDEIFRMVRKNQLPADMPLFMEANKLKNSIIVHGEYLLPAIKEKGLGADEIVNSGVLEEYRNIINAIENGDSSAIERLRAFAEYTYKGVLEKSQFYKAASVPGDLFFIDVKDMGLVNIRDNLNKITEDVASGMQKSEERWLSSGDIMTDKFQQLKSKLEAKAKELYPDSEISIYLGGDEVGIHASGRALSAEQTKAMNSAIHDAMAEIGLEGRVSSKNVVEGKDGVVDAKEVFGDLDKKTKISKIIETRLDEIKSGLEVLIKKGNLTIEKKNELIAKMDDINHFDIHIARDSQIYLRFEGNPFGVGNEYIPASSIVNLKEGEMVPDSLFTGFLDRAGLGRNGLRAANDAEYLDEAI